MQANLKHFFVRLALTAMTTLGLSLRLSAHDLPADKSLRETATANCFTSGHAAGAIHKLPLDEQNSVATPQAFAPLADDWSRRTLLHCALQQASPALLQALNQRPELWKQLSKTTATFSTFGSPSLAVLAKNDFQSESSSVIAAPDEGVAPRPKRKALPGALAQAQLAKTGEVYMPYDFRISDWRFGQFPYHGKTLSAPRPTTLPSLACGVAPVPTLAVPVIAEPKSHPPTAQSLALGEFLQQVDQWQCTANAALSNGAALTRAANSIAESIKCFAIAGGRSLLAVTPAPSLASSQPASHSKEMLGPQFVIYDTAVGGHIVLTLAQARDWQFEVPSAESRLKSQQRLTELLSAGFKPIQTSVLITATDGLQRAGQTLLNLSRSLSNISQPHVASGAQDKHR